MVGLIDIAPSTRTVPVDGQDVPVYGVSAHGIAYLLSRFPELGDIVAQRETDIDPSTLMRIVPDAITSIIAAGTGYPGNQQAEEVAGRLGADLQLDFLKVIIELTMPKGVHPFLEKFSATMQALDVSVKVQGTPSPSPSSN